MVNFPKDPWCTAPKTTFSCKMNTTSSSSYCKNRMNGTWKWKSLKFDTSHILTIGKGGFFSCTWENNTTSVTNLWLRNQDGKNPNLLCFARHDGFIKNCQGALFYFHRFNPTEIQNQPPPSEVEYKSVSELSKCTHRNSFWLSVGTTDLAINAITVSTLPLDLGRTPRMKWNVV